MIHCAIIGAGQIGSRHLQALCQFEKPIRVDLVDPSDESLQTAQSRFEEVISSGKPDTELHKEKGITFKQCQACGARSSVRSIK